MNYPQPADSTVIVIDDDPDMRDALEVLLGAADYSCRVFASGEEFLAEPLPMAPRCMVLDLQLDGKSGLEIQAELTRRNAHLPILFLSGEASIGRAVSAMKGGALDFLQKPFDSERLLSCVAQALQLSAQDHDHVNSSDEGAEVLSKLTRREHETLALLVAGNLNKEVARTLGISVRTVETHRKHIMTKVGARTVADLVRVWLINQNTARQQKRTPWQLDPVVGKTSLI